MNTVTTQNQKGFTLVEIAIVLVIIGLLLGGVLKGQELITNSKIKSTTGDLEGISAAYYAYQDRTGLIPGGNANNNGQINSITLFWQDLRREGFIAGGASDTSGPRHALDGSFIASGFQTDVFGGGKNFICATNVEESIAQGMDNKLDDGNATSGSIVALAGSAVPTADITTNYATPATSTAWTVCKEL